MPCSFVFHVALNAKDRKRQCCSPPDRLLELEDSLRKNNDEIFRCAIESDQVAVSMAIHQKPPQQPSLLALFLPPNVLDPSYRTMLDMVESTVDEVENFSRWKFPDQFMRNEWTSSLLNLIHRNLEAHNPKIRGLICTLPRTQTNGGSHVSKSSIDVVLLDVIDLAEEKLAEMVVAVNGDEIVSMPGYVLKVLPLSRIEFSRTLPAFENSPDGAPSFSSSYEIPSCPVCLHRIDPTRLGLPTKSGGLCVSDCTVDSCSNHKLLRPWPPPSCCGTCDAIQRYSENSLVPNELYDCFCHECAMQATLWVCLTCGFVGCGRYSQGHAAEHFKERQHPFSLELATQRIWDYANGGAFAHRRDFLLCPVISDSVKNDEITAARLVEHDKDLQSAVWSDQNHKISKPKGEVYPPTFAALPIEGSPKKATMIGEEYEALLQSALEEQAQFYEGEISRLCAAITAEKVDQNSSTDEERKQIESLNLDVARLRADIDNLSRELLSAQAQEAAYRVASQKLLREQTVAKDLLEKIQEEAKKEHDQGRMKVEDLEQQISELSANLRMRRQFSEVGELNNAQIVGTTPKEKNARRGKKKRRNVRR